MTPPRLDITGRTEGAFQQTVRLVFKEYKYFWIALLVVGIDQVVKFMVKLNMNPYDEAPIIGETFSVNFIENKGAAFGLTVADISAKLGFKLSEDTAKLILTLFSIGALMVIVTFLRRVRQHRTLLPFALALILGGALGNIVDRVFYGVWFAGINDYEGGLLHGRVVDMFYLDVYHGQIAGIDVNLWPVFNIADFAITVGIIMVLIFQRRFFKGFEVEKKKPVHEEIPVESSTDEAKPEQDPL